MPRLRALARREKKMAGSKLGSTMISFSAGQRVINRGRVSLGNTRQCNDLLQPLFEQFDTMARIVKKMQCLLSGSDEDCSQLLEALTSANASWARMHEIPEAFKEVSFRSIFNRPRAPTYASSSHRHHLAIILASFERAMFALCVSCLQRVLPTCRNVHAYIAREQRGRERCFFESVQPLSDLQRGPQSE